MVDGGGEVGMARGEAGGHGVWVGVKTLFENVLDYFLEHCE